MLSDARTFGSGTELLADVCIVGAGAAGISLAREFSGAQFKVLLLESGGLKFEHTTQFLARGENAGRSYIPLETTHRRQFGGTTAVWFGRCRPLDEIDFEQRPWVASSGWPISKSDLDPFYVRAHAICQLGEYDYRVNTEALGGSGLESKVFFFSPPTHFGKVYLPQFQRAENIHTVIHANASNISINSDGNIVSQIECTTLNKKAFSVKAKIYILAAGGVENPRLLLISRNDHSGGIGNQHDLVGRFFMEHPFVFSGAVIELPQGFPEDYLKLNYETFQRNIQPTKALGLPESSLRNERLLNASAFLVKRPIHKTDDRFYSRRSRGSLQLIETLQHRRPPSAFVIQNLGETILYSGTTLGLAGKAIRGRIGSLSQYAIHVQAETVPNIDSRVTLSSERDALGISRVRLEWKLSAQDLESYQRFEGYLYKGLEKIGFRIRKFNHDLETDGWPVFMAAGKHHMGTTRMSRNPSQGVVDENCRVHGLSNLFIAGSSVFPTSGMANPTLTIVALAIRLAEHVKQILG